MLRFENISITYSYSTDFSVYQINFSVMKLNIEIDCKLGILKKLIKQQYGNIGELKKKKRMTTYFTKNTASFTTNFVVKIS